MTALAAAPLVVALLLRMFADHLARRLRPSLAVPLLTGLALSVALCTGLVLSILAVLVCVQVGPLPRLGHWSASTLHAGVGFPAPLGILALMVVAGCLVAAGVRSARSVHSLLSAGRMARQLQPVTGDLVLVHDETPTAYSVAGLPGRIVVSTSMLSALLPAERRVLLAHEAAHLRHRHHLYLHLALLAASANPLLRPCADAVARAIERWADEDAADEVGDRPLAARALARAALARAAHPAVRHALSAADDRVAERVQLLLASPPIQRRLPIALIMMAALVSWCAAGSITLWAHDLLQLAEQAYPGS
jgi:Zn-dependent protease with chaperone function